MIDPMIKENYLDSIRSIYSLAHTISANGMMQAKLIDDLHDIEQEYSVDECQVIKKMLKVLLSNFP